MTCLRLAGEQVKLPPSLSSNFDDYILPTWCGHPDEQYEWQAEER